MYDLRSDTVTKPSKEVLMSALDAELGDDEYIDCLLYTSPSPRDRVLSRMPSSA